MKQSSITFIIFIIKMNVRLIRASQFLRKFRFNVKYKFNTKYIMSNAFSRFISIIKSSLFENHSKFDILYIYVT